MTGLDRFRIAKEVIEDIGRDYYEVNGKKILFENDISAVKFYEYKGNEVITIDKKKKGKITVSNSDTFVASRKYVELGKTVVLNFASALYPGGGFETGAAAQEESLCRASTLYKSLKSENAGQFYQLQHRDNKGLYASHILLSPNVIVYRDTNGNCMEDNYKVGVITAAAVNVNFATTKKYSIIEINYEMLNRARVILNVAIKEGYTNIILGAWGCGVFRNKAEDVVEIFKQTLIREGYRYAFDNIEFAVYDRTVNQENYIAFETGFKGY